MKLFFCQCRALVRLSLLELWRRNDIFGLLVLALALLVPLSAMKPFGASGAVRYVDEVALLLVWGYSLFISLGTGARAFPPEFESRTIYPLLAKPVSRGALLVGKYLGACTASLSALAFFYLLFVLSCAFRGTMPGVDLVQAFVLHAAFVALAVALALLGSLLVTPSANLTLMAILLGGMFFFGRRLPAYAETAGGALKALVLAAYGLAPHAEFFDMRQRVIHGWGAVEPGVFLAVLAYAIVYVTVVLLLARFVLGRRRL